MHPISAHSALVGHGSILPKRALPGIASGQAFAPALHPGLLAVSAAPASSTSGHAAHAPEAAPGARLTLAEAEAAGLPKTYYATRHEAFVAAAPTMEEQARLLRSGDEYERTHIGFFGGEWRDFKCISLVLPMDPSQLPSPPPTAGYPADHWYFMIGYANPDMETIIQPALDQLGVPPEYRDYCLRNLEGMTTEFALEVIARMQPYVNLPKPSLASAQQPNVGDTMAYRAWINQWTADLSAWLASPGAEANPEARLQGELARAFLDGLSAEQGRCAGLDEKDFGAGVTGSILDGDLADGGKATRNGSEALDAMLYKALGASPGEGEPLEDFFARIFAGGAGGAGGADFAQGLYNARFEVRIQTDSEGNVYFVKDAAYNHIGVGDMSGMTYRLVADEMSGQSYWVYDGYPAIDRAYYDALGILYRVDGNNVPIRRGVAVAEQLEGMKYYRLRHRTVDGQGAARPAALGMPPNGVFSTPKINYEDVFSEIFRYQLPTNAEARAFSERILSEVHDLLFGRIGERGSGPAETETEREREALERFLDQMERYFANAYPLEPPYDPVALGRAHAAV